MTLTKYLTAMAVAVAMATNTLPAISAAEPGRVLTEDGGQPVGDNQNSRTAGPRGSVLLDNFHLIQKLSRFDRERIPERVVHARGVGAHGEFVSYGDYSQHTRAKLFGAKGKRTPVFVRFSTVIHPGGSPESLRDPRGFAVKFYTEDGNWDLVGNNLPVFFIRDAMKFPDMVHSLKPSPVTNQQDPNRFFDFFSHVPESTQMLTFVYSDQGTPANLRQMDGFGVHAFKWVNADGQVTYVKFNWRSMQGHKRHTAKEAAEATAMNHSNHTEDLYQAIGKGEYPSWELGVQMLKPEQLDGFDFDPLDATKVWIDVPELKVGKMTLNRTPGNFFEATEQAAFSPGMIVPGIEPSEDRLLQGRLFSYADTQRYRIGVNYLMLPINRPVVDVVNNSQHGAMNFGETKSDVNYEPSVSVNVHADPAAKYSQANLVGSVEQQRIAKTLNFQQAGELYRSFSKSEQANLISNLAGDMKKVRDKQVRQRMVGFFYQADADYGSRLAEALGDDLGEVKALVSATKDVEPTMWKRALNAATPAARATGGGK
ncbi:Catalase precursor [Anatilimnocola aggregata]|uniref:Catalase n=1 Tax=Anatilimnocola aggregata TaxID=2528021 RepID=A0A517YKH4_9BACT|nr:catalase [Anatilimnocola aggregata]QDU30731.1 Catalase precursor [Anatilimnocola aggregata]